MKKKVLIKKLLVWSVGIGVGAVVGWLYWYYFGCQDTCTIKSSPVNMTIYGGVMGGLLADIISGYFRRK